MDFKGFWNLWSCIDFLLLNDNVVTRHIQGWNSLDCFIGILGKSFASLMILSWLNIMVHSILESATNPIHGTFPMMPLVIEPAKVNWRFKFDSRKNTYRERNWAAQPSLQTITFNFSGRWVYFSLTKWITFCRHYTDTLLEWSDVSDVTLIAFLLIAFDSSLK